MTTSYVTIKPIQMNKPDARYPRYLIMLSKIKNSPPYFLYGGEKIKF